MSPALANRFYFFFTVNASGKSCGSDGKKCFCNAGNMGSIPGSKRSPEEGNGYPLQCSCLENYMDREPDGL